jgi:hypothetical protein
MTTYVYKCVNCSDLYFVTFHILHVAAIIRNKQMFPWSEARSVHKVDILTVIFSRLSRECAILNISQPFRLPRTVTGRDSFIVGELA